MSGGGDGDARLVSECAQECDEAASRGRKRQEWQGRGEGGGAAAGDGRAATAVRVTGEQRRDGVRMLLGRGFEMRMERIAGPA